MVRVQSTTVGQEVLLLVGEAQPAACLKVCVDGPLEQDAGIQRRYAQGAIQDTVY